MKKITPFVFIYQLLVKDLFGKDSQRGISLTYSWLANQLGHFTLGFIPSVILSRLYWETNEPYFYSIYVALFWIVFKMFNLTIPLFLVNKNTIFKPDWNHLIFDTVTDILYFSLGSVSSCLFINPQNTIGKWIAITLILLLIYPFIYWYTIKIYQQYAYFPFQFRLSQWSGEFLDLEEQKIITSYIDKTPTTTGNHLLIYGKVSEGKSNLGIAIANEITLKKQTCTYTTAIKLYNLFYSNIVNSDLLWTWKEAKYLIIDDIKPDKLKHISNIDFLKYVDKFADINIENRTLLKNKNIIWVLGDCLESKKNQWRELLKEINVPENKISFIDLSR